MRSISNFYVNSFPEDLFGCKNHEFEILDYENFEFFWWCINNMNTYQTHTHTYTETYIFIYSVSEVMLIMNYCFTILSEVFLEIYIQIYLIGIWNLRLLNSFQTCLLHELLDEFDSFFQPTIAGTPFSILHKAFSFWSLLLFIVALTTFVKPHLVITLFFMIIVKSTKKLANLAIFLVLIQGL